MTLILVFLETVIGLEDSSIFPDGIESSELKFVDLTKLLGTGRSWSESGLDFLIGLVFF